jgi:hypothetical protein
MYEGKSDPIRRTQSAGSPSTGNRSFKKAASAFTDCPDFLSDDLLFVCLFLFSLVLFRSY